jgi:hypothetical protein
MQLHLGVPLTPGDASTMASIAEHQPDGQFRDAVIGLLVREVLLSPSEPGTHFADDIVDDVRQLQQQAENRPASTIRLASDDDDSLRAALESTQPDPVSYQALLAHSQQGRASLADIARFAVRPYAAVLLHRPGGLMAAFDLGPGLRQAGEDAAKQAVQDRTCVADLSALYLLGLISEDDRLRVRDAIPSMITSHAAGDWIRGPAHTALARQEWWRYHGDNWTDTWLTVATEARRHSAAALLEITGAALVGSVAYASPGQRTKHYQELVVLALVACHNIAEQPPDNLLADLAKDAGPGLAPSPKYVLKALVAELEKLSVSAALEVTLRMLPGVDLL